MKKIYWSLAITLITCIIALGVLSFGNTQWHKYIFMYQAYILKIDIDVSKGYSGIWKQWHENGNVLCESKYKDGKLHGLEKYYEENGNVGIEATYFEGELRGVFKLYHLSKGKIKMERYFKDITTPTITKSFSENGVLESIYYFNDVRKIILIYDPSKSIDLRHKYKKQLLAFKKALRAHEKKHGFPQAPPIIVE